MPPSSKTVDMTSEVGNKHHTACNHLVISENNLISLARQNIKRKIFPSRWLSSPLGNTRRF